MIVKRRMIVNFGAVWIQLKLVSVCLCVRMLCIFVSVWLAWWEEHRGRGFVAGDFPSETHTHAWNQTEGLNRVPVRHLQSHQKPAAINHNVSCDSFMIKSNFCQNHMLHRFVLFMLGNQPCTIYVCVMAISSKKTSATFKKKIWMRK